jgi:hypothetical protein
MNSQYNYYISNKGLHEECDKEETTEVSRAATTPSLKRKLQNVLSNVTSWSGHRQAGDPLTNIQSTLRGATDLCQNVSFTVLFDSNSNSHTLSTQSYVYVCMCVYIYILYIYIFFKIRGPG